jgi:hypothetical protein
MLRIYAIGDFVGPKIYHSEQITIDDMVLCFKNCKLILFYSNEQTARVVQRLTRNCGSGYDLLDCRVLFDLTLNLGSAGPYITRLNNASFLRRGEEIKLTLDYPMNFLVNAEQCNALGIMSKSELDKVATFLLCNETIQDSTKLLRENTKQILNYYNQLVFFKKEPPVLRIQGFAKAEENDADSGCCAII